MEAYIDDMVDMSTSGKGHVADLKEPFESMRRVGMRLAAYFHHTTGSRQTLPTRILFESVY